jgi:hypothetical protein
MTEVKHRKVVTILFCDVTGSTSLGESVDPEALQGLLVRYFERMKGIVAEGTDMIGNQARAQQSLGEVLCFGRRPAEAEEAFRKALESYERKGNVVMAERTRERLASLRQLDQ